MSDVQTTCDVDTAPVNTSGYATIRRGYADQEDIKWRGVSGLQLTSLLRGLSPTALTDTEVVGLKKAHILNTPNSTDTIEGTTLHYIINNKTDVDDDEVITGLWTLSNASPTNITAGVKTSTVQYLPLSIKDSSGAQLLGFTPAASAANSWSISSAAIGGAVILSTLGVDANINAELQCQGTGFFIIPNGSQLKTNAPPTVAQGIANKKYVDDTVAASASGNASTIQKGVSEEATDIEVATAQVAGSTGARLFINPGSTTTSSRTTNKIPVTVTSPDGSIHLDPNIFDPDRMYAPLTSVIGENVTGGDIAANQNLLYQEPTDGKWYKVTSTTSTWYKRLGLLLDAANTGDTGKRILLKGIYTGLTFANINPTFANATGSTGVLCGASSNSIAAFPIDNTSGAEITIPGNFTITALKNGTPVGQMDLALVLEQQEQANSPAVIWDTSLVMSGAILATTSIPIINFSGVYQNFNISFGSVTIPAKSRIWLCASMRAATNVTNYYTIKAAGAGRIYDEATGTWGGSINAAVYSATGNSTSPLAYSVKAYAGANGSFGIVPTNPWSKVIGQVITTTSFYFDPENRQEDTKIATGYTCQIGAGGFTAVTSVNTGFCPSMLNLIQLATNNASTTTYQNRIGFLRGDRVGATTSYPDGGGNLVGAPAAGFVQLSLNAGANKVYAVRLENGVIFYNGYPTGGAINGGASGFTSLGAAFTATLRV